MTHPTMPDTASRDTLPLYLKQQLQDTVTALEAAVRAKGLEAVLDFELWEFKQSVQGALTRQDAQLAKRVVAGRHAFMARVAALPARQPSGRVRNDLLLTGY